MRRVIALAGAFILFAWGVAYAHATLLSSEPAARSRLAESPTRIRLVFSEALEPTLGRIALVGADGVVRQLTSAGDPRDVHALVAPVEMLSPGAYRVQWRVVSADGHAVQGSYVFTIATDTSATVAPMPTRPMPATEPPSSGAMMASTPVITPVITPVLRGLAIGALMALGGLLLFATLAADEARRAPSFSTVAGVLAVSAVVLLAAHALSWFLTVSADHALTADSIADALATRSGRLELWRVALALLALWGVTLARRIPLALVFALGALLVSGASGHSAALSPAWAIPAKALHLVAGAMWLGGLVWLVVVNRGDALRFLGQARRVSAVALGAVTVVALTGLVQVALFLPSWTDVFRSPYGYIVLGKVAGLGVLVGFGAYHRFRVLPALAGNARLERRLRGSLGGELALMAIVVLLGGLLAYTPPPELVHDGHMSHMTQP